MRRDISQAKSELWLRYAKKKEIRRHRERVTVLCVCLAMCGVLATVLPAAFTDDGDEYRAGFESCDELPADIARDTESAFGDETGRGGCASAELSFGPKDVKLFDVAGEENLKGGDKEFDAALLRAVGEIKLYRSDTDDSPTATKLTLVLENGNKTELCITVERNFVIDGTTYRAENADALFDLLADAGIEFNE